MVAWLAEGCLLVEDRALAARLYPIVERFAARNHSWGIPSRVCEGPISEHVGRLAALLGRPQEAARHLEDALARCNAMGAQPHVERIARALEELRSVPERRASAPATAPSLQHEGDVWKVSFGTRSARLRDSRGLRMLAQLVAEAGREFHVLELEGLDPAGDSGDAGEALDPAAISAYRARAQVLRAELGEAESWSDLGRAARAREELEALAAQLARGVDLRGRPRREGSRVERARINVRRRVVDAIRRVAEELPDLGAHLSATIRTGTTCVYLPEGRPISSALRGRG
jgi:hypothetical protein